MVESKNFIIKSMGNNEKTPNSFKEADPYDTPYFQANLVKQKKEIFLQTRLKTEDEQSRTRIHIQISLVPGSVEVSYNSDIISFANQDEEVSFRREINSFFIRNDFRLDSIYFPISVYKCGTKAVGDTTEFIFSPNDMFLSDTETHTLNLIVSKVLQRAMFA